MRIEYQTNKELGKILKEKASLNEKIIFKPELVIEQVKKFHSI
jgi:hypothetical protein